MMDFGGKTPSGLSAISPTGGEMDGGASRPALKFNMSRVGKVAAPNYSPPLWGRCRPGRQRGSWPRTDRSTLTGGGIKTSAINWEPPHAA